MTVIIINNKTLHVLKLYLKHLLNTKYSMKRMSGSSVNVLDVLLAVYSFYLVFLVENTTTISKTSPNIIHIYKQIKKYANENSHLKSL